MTHVDNFHTCYINLDSTYILPAIPTSGINFHSAQIFLKNIHTFLPETLSRYQIFPMFKPEVDSHKISLVNEISLKGNTYIHNLKFDLNYMGGASNEEIISMATQDFGPSIFTNKIYFSSRLFQVKNIVREKGQIIQFDTYPYQFKEISNIEEGFPDDSDKKIIEIFDEVDHSSKINAIKEYLGISTDIYKLGNIYSPFFIEYNTLSLSFLKLNYSSIEKYFESFVYLFKMIFEKKKYDSELKFYTEYLKKFHFKRKISRGGNINWEIHFS
ncbi:MAG: hypothetical protein H7A24_09115 [Leptospiraceae bacterium]|nr:hypothetical protein [Leptospiraceae bacterium]